MMRGGFVLQVFIGLRLIDVFYLVLLGGSKRDSFVKQHAQHEGGDILVNKAMSQRSQDSHQGAVRSPEPSPHQHLRREQISLQDI